MGLCINWEKLTDPASRNEQGERAISIGTYQIAKLCILGISGNLEDYVPQLSSNEAYSFCLGNDDLIVRVQAWGMR